MLNEEQRRMVENSIWVVNTALKKQGLECDKDLKQDALLCMCQCAERFDASKGIKWTTYAYKNVYLYIKRTHSKQQKKASYIVKDDLFDLADQIEEPMYEYDLDTPTQRFRKFTAICTPNETTLLEAKLKGFNHTEIAEQMNCSKSKVDITMRGIKEKAREMTL